MPSSLSKFTGYLTEKYWPSVACPRCGHGNLRLKGTVHDVWDSATVTTPSHHGMSELEYGGAFTAELRCDDGNCQEGVVVAGACHVDEQWEDPSQERLQTFYSVRFVHPALRLFDLPSGTPAKVAAGVVSASSVMWTSPSSAANRLRYAVEEILTAEGVSTTGTNGKGHLTAGPRIKLYEDDTTNPNAKLAPALRAVTHIGNEGSHEEVLTTSHILHDAEILSHVVVALYGTGNAAIEAKIKAVNDAKGIANAAV